MKLVLSGIALAILSAVIILSEVIPYSYEVQAILLAAIGSIYIGFGLSDSHPHNLRLEVLVAALFFGIAIAGYWISPTITGMGFVLHGVWDFLHHPQVVKTAVPRWYPPFCAVYDWVLAACLFSSQIF
ncbi:MAG: hypothetical protein F6K31_07040 [Symploca sp. SIO2G7]|nr:hypothetical protein [Symploca sp. SIO2G7]